MREIKFRAWDIDNNEMRIVSGLGWVDGKIDGVCFNREELTFRDSVKLMQYTGLKDKNGKEIYEGDIIKSQYFMPSIVKFKNGCFIFEDISVDDAQSTYRDNEWEVLGNIYENAELL